MTRSKTIGLLVIGFLLMVSCIGNEFMSGHHIRSKLHYGSSSVEGSRLGFLKYEYDEIILICDGLDVGIASELQVEAAGHRLKVAGLTLKEFEALGIPMENIDYAGNARRYLKARNASLNLNFSKDGRLYSVAFRFSHTDETQTNTVALLRNKVIVNGVANTAQIKALLGEPKDKSLRLRIQ